MYYGVGRHLLKGMKKKCKNVSAAVHWDGEMNECLGIGMR